MFFEWERIDPLPIHKFSSKAILKVSYAGILSLKTELISVDFQILFFYCCAKFMGSYIV